MLKSIPANGDRRMSKPHHSLLATACAAALLAGATSAQGAISFNFMNLQPSGTEVSDNQVVTGSDTVTTARLAGWANSGNDSADSGGSTWNTMLQGKLVSWGSSGVGMYYRNPNGTFESGNPNHAIDNDGPDEFVLLYFNTPVELTQVTLGWPDETQYDTDITVLSYGGVGTPDLGVAFSQGGYASAGTNTLEYQDGAAGTTAGLTNDGWDFVGHYADVAVGSNTVNINSIGKTSSYWLIGAYSPAVVNNGTCYTDAAGTACGTGALDYFKLKSVAAKDFPPPPPPPPGVPEPASLGLVVLGLIGARRMSGRRVSG